METPLRNFASLLCLDTTGIGCLVAGEASFKALYCLQPTESPRSERDALYTPSTSSFSPRQLAAERTAAPWGAACHPLPDAAGSALFTTSAHAATDTARGPTSRQCHSRPLCLPVSSPDGHRPPSTSRMGSQQEDIDRAVGQLQQQHHPRHRAERTKRGRGFCAAEPPHSYCQRESRPNTHHR